MAANSSGVKWGKRAFVVVIVAAGIGLVWLQKNDVVIDPGWSIEVDQEWSIHCKDGTRGTFIGHVIKLEGCETKPTHRILPLEQEGH